MKMQPIKQINRYAERLTGGIWSLKIFGNFFGFDIKFGLNDETKAFPFIFTFAEPNAISRHFLDPQANVRTLEINGQVHSVFTHSLEKFSEADKGKATEVYVVYLNERSGITPEGMSDDNIKLHWLLVNEIIDPDVAKAIQVNRFWRNHIGINDIALNQIASSVRKPIGKKYNGLGTDVVNVIRMDDSVDTSYLHFNSRYSHCPSHKLRLNDNFFILPPDMVAHFACKASYGCKSIRNGIKTHEFKEIEWVNEDDLSEGLVISESSNSLCNFGEAKEHDQHPTPEKKIQQVMSVLFSELAGEEVQVKKVHLSLQSDWDEIGIKGLDEPKFIGILPLVTFDKDQGPIIYPIKGGQYSKGYEVFQDEKNKDEFLILLPREYRGKESAVSSIFNDWNQFFEQFDIVFETNLIRYLYGGGGHRTLSFNDRANYYFTEDEVESRILVLESEE